MLYFIFMQTVDRFVVVVGLAPFLLFVNYLVFTITYIVLDVRDVSSVEIRTTWANGPSSNIRCIS